MLLNTFHTNHFVNDWNKIYIVGDLELDFGDSKS